MVDENKSKEPIPIADDAYLSRPSYQEKLPVSWADWDFIKSRITRCRVVLDIWGYATSFFFSIAIFALAMLITTERAVSGDTWISFLAVTIAGFLAAVLCLLARFSSKHKQGEHIKTVLEDMGQIELRYQRPVVENEQKENE